MRALDVCRAEWRANQATDAPRVTFEEWAWAAGFRHKFLREAHGRRQAAGDYVDLFAGPGGWDCGLRMLDVHNVRGFEWDKAACDTAVAAGFRRVQADISKLDPRRFDSTGLIASPPCTKFSAAGSGVGNRVLDYLSEGIRAILAGGDALAIIEAVRAAILPTCLEEREAANAKRRKPWTADKVAAKAAEDAFTTALVLEPARWIMGMDSLRWVALEQVPQVLPLWDVYAECLRELGWSVWTGVLNAADYGVPQTRRRAILIASVDRKVTRPEPTHAERPIPTLFGELAGWVTMAEALGWDVADAVMPARGLGMIERHGDRAPTPADHVAPTVIGKSRSWARIVTNQRSNGSADYYERSTDEPAPKPGHRDREGGERQHTDSISVTVQEAAILQSFPADYPWQGSKTKQYEQVSNAIPPLLAAHVLAEVLGVELAQERAA